MISPFGWIDLGQRHLGGGMSIIGNPLKCDGSVGRYRSAGSPEAQRGNFFGHDDGERPRRLKRPFRVHVDPSQDGAEVVNAVADRMRREMYRNIGLIDLLSPRFNS